MRAQMSRLAAYVILIAGMTFCRAGFLENVFYNIDEAEYAVAADALSHGWLPGVDLLGSTKPPGIVFLYYALFHIFGRSLAVVHIAHLVIVILTGALIVELARRLFGTRAMIPAALLFWITSNVLALPEETLALNVESPGLLLTAAALLLAWRIPEKRMLALGAGILLGAAVMFRQSFLFFLIPVLSPVFRGDRPWRVLAILIVGAVIPWIPVLSVYVAHGGLGWAMDSWIRYPLTYSSDLGVGGFFGMLWDHGVDVLSQEWHVIVLALVGAYVMWRQRATPRSQFLFLLVIASVLAVCSGSRFFGHYWIQAFLAVTLFGVAGWEWLWAHGQMLRRATIALMVLASLLALRHFPLWRQWAWYAPPRGVSSYALGKTQAEIQLGEYAQTHTAENQTILVWGYCPQIYYHARRLPGVRDYLVHYVTGFSPAAFFPLDELAPRSSGHPHAREMFLHDLSTRRPAYIFDISGIADYPLPFVQYPIKRYPDIADFIETHYLPDTILSNTYVYRLSPDSAATSGQGRLD